MNQHERTDYCGLVTESLSAYLDRSLPAPVERQIAEHLEECVACRRRLAGMNALLSDLQTLDRVEASPEVGWAIKRMIRREARRERARSVIRPLPFLVSSAAAAVLFILIGFGSATEQATGPVMLTEQTAIETAETPLWERRYVLPAQVGDPLGATVAGKSTTDTDSTVVHRPSRLTGARAVSF